MRKKGKRERERDVYLSVRIYSCARKTGKYGDLAELVRIARDGLRRNVR